MKPSFELVFKRPYITTIILKFRALRKLLGTQPFNDSLKTNISNIWVALISGSLVQMAVTVHLLVMLMRQMTIQKMKK